MRLVGTRGPIINALREKAGCTIQIRSEDLPGGACYPPGTICNEIYVAGPLGNVLGCQSHPEFNDALMRERIATGTCVTVRPACSASTRESIVSPRYSAG